MLRLYTDESAGLRVDPMVVMVLSLGFIFSVVALHCKIDSTARTRGIWTRTNVWVLVIAKITKKFS